MYAKVSLVEKLICFASIWRVSSIKSCWGIVQTAFSGGNLVAFNSWVSVSSVITTRSRQGIHCNRASVNPVSASNREFQVQKPLLHPIYEDAIKYRARQRQLHGLFTFTHLLATAARFPCAPSIITWFCLDGACKLLKVCSWAVVCIWDFPFWSFLGCLWTQTDLQARENWWKFHDI